MVDKVKEYVSEWKMLEKKDRVIVGVSGGADSVCLLFMLMELRREIGFELVVVHVNHQLRGEAAERDEEYVRLLCEREHLPCEICWEDVELIAGNRKQSLEEAGRNVRREAFEQAMKKYGGTKIALAHHKNDNAETLIMNLARGSGLKGLGGMRPVSGTFIRPLLCLERREIEAYLEEKKIAYCTDATNASDHYTRNRIRNHIIPSLEGGVNEKAVAHISGTMEMLRGVWDYMECETEKYYADCVTENADSVLIGAERYQQLPDIFRGNIIHRALVRASGAEKDIHAAHINSVRELMEKQPGKKRNLPYGVTAKRCYEGVRLVREMDKKTEKNSEEWVLDLSKDGEIRIKDMVFSYRILTPEEITEKNMEKTYTKCFNYDIIKNTVAVRTRETGDYITIDKSGRTQKLKSYFINEKIPQEKRDEMLLLAEGKHILWVIGCRRGCAYQIEDKTEKILEIRIDKGESNYGRDN